MGEGELEDDSKQVSSFDLKSPESAVKRLAHIRTQARAAGYADEKGIRPLTDSERLASEIDTVTKEKLEEGRSIAKKENRPPLR